MNVEHMRQAKCGLYVAILDCHPDELTESDMNLMEALRTDPMIQEVLNKVFPNKRPSELIV